MRWLYSYAQAALDSVAMKTLGMQARSLNSGHNYYVFTTPSTSGNRNFIKSIKQNFQYVNLFFFKLRAR